MHSLYICLASPAKVTDDCRCCGDDCMAHAVVMEYYGADHAVQADYPNILFLYCCLLILVP